VPEILRVVRAVAAHFEQVVLLGYPPFLRDVVDAGTHAGIDWAALQTKLVAAGEVFDEGWRARLCEQLGAADASRTIASLYGTADGGVLANETPTSVRIRRALAERSDLVLKLFGQSRLPTLCQFAPTHRSIETVDDHIVFSADGILPLLRYDILDQGGVITAAEMRAFLRAHGLGAIEVAGDAEPFVYVFGRSGAAISYYGANVYPENIGPGLHRPELAGKVTGKFVLEVVDDAGSAGLRVTVELGRDVDVTPALTSAVRESIVEHLVAQNSEYAHYVPEARRAPELVLKPFGDPADFPPGAKHRYTRN
jgi:phenylacetate-CoA ligase